MKTSIKQFYLITVYVEKWITENYDRLMGLPAYRLPAKYRRSLQLLSPFLGWQWTDGHHGSDHSCSDHAQKRDLAMFPKGFVFEQ